MILTRRPVPCRPVPCRLASHRPAPRRPATCRLPVAVPRLLSLLLLFLAVGLVALLPLRPARAAEPLPPRPVGAGGYGAELPLYERYSLEAFTLDSAVTPIDPAGRSLHLGTNLLLMLKGWLIKLAIRVAEYAVTGDLLYHLAGWATRAMERLQEVLWTAGGAPLVAGALALAGLWALLARLAGRSAASLESLGGTALALLVAYLLLGAAGTLVPWLQEVARAAGTESFGAVARVAGSTGSGLIHRAGSAAWNALVYEPWLEGEFTDREAAVRHGSPELPGSAFLALPLSERVRIYRTEFTNVAAREAEFAPWSEDYAVPRALAAVGTLAAAAAFALPVLLLAGGVLGHQLALLLVTALLPLWLLLALWWPATGIRLLRRVLAVGVAALVLQVVLAATLGVVLVLALGVGIILGPLGWPLQSLILALLGLMAYRYRLAWWPGAAAAVLRRPLSPVAAAGGPAGGFGASRPSRFRLLPLPVAGAPATEVAAATATLSGLDPAAAPAGPRPGGEETGMVRTAALDPGSAAAGPRMVFQQEMSGLRQQLGLVEYRPAAAPTPPAGRQGFGLAGVEATGGVPRPRRRRPADPAATTPAELPRHRLRPPP